MSAYAESAMGQAIERIYDAALDSKSWPAAVQAIGSVMDSEAILLIFDGGRHHARFVVTHGLDPAILDDYYGHYLSVSPYIKPYSSAPCGEVLWADRLVGWDELRDTEFYNEFMQRAGISRSYPGIKLLEDGPCHASIAVNPSVARVDADRSKVEGDLAYLAKHVKQAIKLNQLTEHVCLATQSMELAMEAISAAAFLLDREQRLIHANGKAETLLRDGRLLLKSPAGVLHAWRPIDDSQLALFLGHERWSGTPIRLRSSGSDRCYVAWKVPMGSGRQRESQQVCVARSIWPEAETMLLVAPAEATRQLSEHVVRSAFNLTPAEARLVSALASGQAPADIALAGRVSIKTIRNQLTSVFAKTGTSSQAELLTLVVGTLVLLPDHD